MNVDKMTISELEEKNFGTMSALKYTRTPENNIKYKPYFTDVKYDCSTLQ